MTSLTLTSELEAINLMLEAAEEAPVSSLALAGLYPLDKAKGILSEASRAVQSVGWKFNTEYDFPVTRDGTGNITLPGNMLKFDAEAASDVDPVQRGLKLYDAKAHSYVFTRDIKGTATFLLAWDELPQPARYYISIRAARSMQARSSVTDSAYQYTAADEQAALLALSEHEAEVGDHNMLRDSHSVGSVLAGRHDLSPWH